MSVVTEKPGAETRSILAPTGNRVRVAEEQGRKKEMAKKPAEKPKKVTSEKPIAAVVRCNVSADSSSDSCSSCSGSNVKSGKRRMPANHKAAKIVPDGVEALTLSPAVPLPVKRCDWITPNSGKISFCFVAV